MMRARWTNHGLGWYFYEAGCKVAQNGLVQRKLYPRLSKVNKTVQLSLYTRKHRRFCAWCCSLPSRLFLLAIPLSIRQAESKYG